MGKDEKGERRKESGEWRLVSLPRLWRVGEFGLPLAWG